jgi:hypothetical protein
MQPSKMKKWNKIKIKKLKEADYKDGKIRCFALLSGVSATFSMAVTLWWVLIIQASHLVYTPEEHHCITSQPSQHISHMMLPFSPYTTLSLGTGLWQLIFRTGTNMCGRRCGFVLNPLGLIYKWNVYRMYKKCFPLICPRHLEWKNAYPVLSFIFQLLCNKQDRFYVA